MFSALLTLLPAATLASPNCDSFDSCLDCTSHKTWTGSQCRWCTKDNHCHAELSMLDPCSNSEIAFKPSECPAAPPAPAPAPAPQASPLVAKVLGFLFHELNITADPTTCITDVGRADVALAAFAADVRAGRTMPDGAADLATALDSLATAAAGCGGAGVLQAELRVLAAAARDSRFVAALDVDLKALATAVNASDYAAIAAAIQKLLADWSAVGGCGANATACKFLDGLLKIVGAVATDVAPCEAAVGPAIALFEQGAAALRAKNYSGAVSLFAAGLDAVAVAVATDACGLKGVAHAIAAAVPKLRAAVVKVESSGAVRILVGSADVYDALYHAALDVEHGDTADLGVRLGDLLSLLRASACSTRACDVLEGLLSALQVVASDYTACVASLDAAFPPLERGIGELVSKRWRQGARDVGAGLSGLARAVGACGVGEIASDIEAAARTLNATDVAVEVGAVVHVLSEGADLTLDLQKLARDAGADQWSGVGADLGALAAWLQGTGCSSFVCRLLEGLLDAAAIPFSHLEACAADVRATEADFKAGAAALGAGQLRGAVSYWASGLDELAKSVDGCGLSDELEYVSREAQVLGFGKVSAAVGAAAQILVHGADFYDDVYEAFEGVQSHDWRTAGAELGKVLQQLSEWTSGHACTSDFCYVVLGIFEFLGDIQGDIRACEADFSRAFGNFSAAFDALRNTSAPSGANADFSFNVPGIRQGIADIGHGMLDVAAGVKDCHLAQLAAVLEKLAIKLGVAPEIAWVEEALRILIEGVQIEQEIGSACLDYSEHNWVGFGYNVARLVETLVGVDVDNFARLGAPATVADTMVEAPADCAPYRKLSGSACADDCLPSMVGICPVSIVVKSGGLEAGACKDIQYTVADGTISQKAGPCGTLSFNKWKKPALDVA